MEDACSDLCISNKHAYCKMQTWLLTVPVTCFPSGASSSCRWCHWVPHAFRYKCAPGKIPIAPEHRLKCRFREEEKKWVKLQIFWEINKLSGQSQILSADVERGWGLSEGQKRRSSLAPVIGLGPRLSFLRDQSPRSCLPPDCWINQLSYHQLISHRRLSVAKTISAETPVVVAEQRVWHVCVCMGRVLLYQAEVSDYSVLKGIRTGEHEEAVTNTYALQSTGVFMCQHFLIFFTFADDGHGLNVKFRNDKKWPVSLQNIFHSPFRQLALLKVLRRHVKLPVWTLSVCLCV